MFCLKLREITVLLLAVVDSVQNFHYYLCGRPFFIRTNHSALTWLLCLKNLDGQLARWIGKLDQCDFKILHRKGISHTMHMVSLDDLEIILLVDIVLMFNQNMKLLIY